MGAEEKEISFKEMLSTFIDWIKYLFSKWLVIGIVAAICGGIGVLYAWLAKPTYKASISFVLSSNNQSGNNLLGLASQFGLDLGNSGNDVFAGDNIMTLMKSRKMVQEALLSKYGDNKETLLNLFVKMEKLDKGWEENERTKSAFPFPDNRSNMNMIQDSLFRDVYIGIAEEMLSVSRPDKKEAIYSVETKSKNELFSYYLTKSLVDATSKFYIATKTRMATNNLAMLQHEADSLRILLGGAITSSGAETDKTFNLNPAYQVQRSASQQSQAQVSVLGVAYGEVVKNLELAKITLQKETPLYQVIDEPSLPLIQERPSKLLSLIAGGFIGGLLICGFLIGRRILLQTK